MRGNGREEKHEGGGGESEKRRKRVKRGKKREVNGGISGVERGGGDTVTRKGEGTWMPFYWSLVQLLV